MMLEHRECGHSECGQNYIDTGDTKCCRLGRTYIPDEGGGGAYFLDEAGNLCHAPLEGNRYDWDNATQIDHYDIINPDPGWDFARWARDRLAEVAIDKWEEEHRSEPPLPSHASGVCPNCGQWQHKSSGDCLNECRRRGFAEREHAVSCKPEINCECEP